MPSRVGVVEGCGTGGYLGIRPEDVVSGTGGYLGIRPENVVSGTGGYLGIRPENVVSGTGGYLGIRPENVVSGTGGYLGIRPENVVSGTGGYLGIRPVVGRGTFERPHQYAHQRASGPGNELAGGAALGPCEGGGGRVRQSHSRARTPHAPLGSALLAVPRHSPPYCAVPRDSPAYPAAPRRTPA